MKSIPVLPLKTPLLQGLAGGLKKKRRHEPHAIPSYVKTLIDLTDTYKYYQNKDLP